MNSGSPLVLGWTLGFALPFVLLVALAAPDRPARRWLLAGFLLGAGAAVLLFLAQILRGAETLDFRTNPAFRLPPQYGRGFALMPEVSTFAVHGLIAWEWCWRCGARGNDRRDCGGLAAMLVSLALAPDPVPGPGFGPRLGPARGRPSLASAFVITSLLALILAGFVQLFYAERHRIGGGAGGGLDLRAGGAALSGDGGPAFLGRGRGRRGSTPPPCRG